MSDTPSNIVQFNTLVLALLTHLYKKFPTPTGLDGWESSEIAMGILSDDASGEDAWNSITMIEDVVTFLAEEGFLRYELTPQQVVGQKGPFYNVRLTLKGFSILGSTPGSMLGKRKSLFDRARESLGKMTTAAGQELGRQTIGEIFRMMTE